ncbi:hypothetical protein SDC9_167513 [bioreactor metagenome]|uniref:Uncharacterized protein n=1 Tax=bioreactor metagenome TaxID=1076179 RepID=A0A645G1U6_9ZZZZ
MGTCQHGDLLPRFGIGINLRDETFEFRDIDYLQCFLPHHRGGRVVDILRGQPKMDELFVIGQLKLVEFFLQKIFYCLHIVIGNFFNILDFQGIFFGEVFIQRS